MLEVAGSLACAALALAPIAIPAPAARIEIPAVFRAGRVFVTPRVAHSRRRLVLWVDTDGSGFLRGSVVRDLHLRRVTVREAHGRMEAANLPPFAHLTT